MKEMDKSVDIEDNFPYKDIINTKYPFPITHQRQPMDVRAGQFAPFAALTGYGEQVKETEKYTDKEVYLDEDTKILLDEQLNYIRMNKELEIKIIYFIKDSKKSGGKYITKLGKIKKIDNYKKEIVFEDKEKIKIDNIIKIEVIN